MSSTLDYQMVLHFEYYVVEFLHQPYLDVETYVCVPLSWIQEHVYGPTDRRVAVAYPAEPLTIMKKLLRDKRSPRKGWKRYSAIIRFGTNKLGDAKSYINDKKNISEDKKKKIHKNKINNSASRAQDTGQRISSESCMKEFGNKELKVKIHRNSPIEENLRQQLTDNSKKKPIKRFTVIERTGSVSKTNNSNKDFRDTYKQHLMSVNNDVKENARKSQNIDYKNSSKTTKQILCLTNNTNENNLHQVDKNTTTNVHQCDESFIDSDNQIPHILNQGVESYSYVVSNLQNNSNKYSKHDTSYECNKKLQHNPHSQNRIQPVSNTLPKTGHEDCKATNSQNVPITQHYVNKTCVHSQVSHASQRDSFLIVNEPNLYQDLYQKDVVVVENGNLNNQNQINYSSRVGIKSPSHAQCNSHNVINQRTGIFNHMGKNRYLTINKKPNNYPNEQKKYSDPAKIPFGQINVPNLPKQCSQIEMPLNYRQHSAVTDKETIQKLPAQEILSMANINESNLDQSITKTTSNRLSNKAGACSKHVEVTKPLPKSTILNAHLLSTLLMENSQNSTSDFVQHFEPLINNQFQLHNGNDSFQNLTPEAIIKENCTVLKSCFQNNITNGPETTKNSIMYDSPRKIIEIDSNSTSNPSTSLTYSTVLPKWPFVHELPSNCRIYSLASPKKEKEVSVKRAKISNIVDQKLLPQITIMKVPPIQQELNHNNPNTSINKGLNKADDCFPKTATNSSNAYNIPIGLNHFPEVINTKNNSANPHQVNSSISNIVHDRDCSPSQEIRKLQISAGYVVNDPRKIIIKNIVNIKPWKTGDHALKNNPLKTQIERMQPVTENHTRLIHEKLNVMKEISDYSNRHNINKTNGLRKRTCHENVNSTVSIVSKKYIQDSGNHLVDSHLLSTTISGNHLQTKQPRLMLNQNTSVSRISTVENLLSLTRNSENKAGDTNTYKNNDHDNNNNNVYRRTSIETDKADKIIKQFENNHSKNKESLMFSNNEESPKNCNETDVDVAMPATKEQANPLSKSMQEKNPQKTNEIKIKEDDMRNFMLPSEYNPNDSRWTLKHQEASPGVVELIPSSHIYINEKKLKDSLSIAHNYNALARSLLLEIFSFDALRVCSLTGAKNNFGYRSPALNVFARSMIIKYIEEHGRTLGWSPMNELTVLNSLRSKLHEIRKKFETS